MWNTSGYRSVEHFWISECGTLLNIGVWNTSEYRSVEHFWISECETLLNIGVWNTSKYRSQWCGWEEILTNEDVIWRSKTKFLLIFDFAGVAIDLRFSCEKRITSGYKQDVEENIPTKKAMCGEFTNFDIKTNFFICPVTFLLLLTLTLILLTWKIGWPPNNVSRWETGYNSAFKGLSEK